MGIDPGTVSAGVALMSFREGEAPMLLDYRALRAKSPVRVIRLQQMNRQLREFTEMCDTPDIIVYEQPHALNMSAVIGLNQAIGALIVLAPRFGKCRYIDVRPNQVKAAMGQTGFFQKGNKLEKSVIIEAANRLYGLSLGEEDDAIADAIGICHAGYKKYLGDKDSQRVRRPASRSRSAG
jgi:Holliday junction resolvasome RuvABC endonuclease subunit